MLKKVGEYELELRWCFDEGKQRLNDIQEKLSQVKLMIISSAEKLECAKNRVEKLKASHGMDLAYESGLVRQKPQTSLGTYKEKISIVMEDPEESKENDESIELKTPKGIGTLTRQNLTKLNLRNR